MISVQNKRKTDLSFVRFLRIKSIYFLKGLFSLLINTFFFVLLVFWRMRIKVQPIFSFVCKRKYFESFFSLPKIPEFIETFLLPIFFRSATENDAEHILYERKKIRLRIVSKEPDRNLQWIYFLVLFCIRGAT